MKRAVLVGIDEYDHLKPLHGCVNDVTALLPLLQRNGDTRGPDNFESRAFTSANGYVGRRELRGAIDVALQPGVDFSLFYFAGHGMPEQNDVVLVSQDGNAGDYGVPLSYVLTKVQQSPVSEIVIILDCCYSGGGGVPQLGSSVAVLRHGFSLLTASRGDQEAAEFGRGLFSQQLCDALAGGAADALGHVTLAGIYSYLSESFGAFDQRPTFRANVDRLTDIRLCEPAITVEDARQLVTTFSHPDMELPLDPTYEWTAKVKKRNPANEAVFAILQRCRGKARRACRSRPYVRCRNAEEVVPSHSTRQALLATRQEWPAMNVGISGHQDIPEQVRPDLRRRLTQTLARSGAPVMGVTSVAAGADQLFADVVLKLGGELHVVLPCAEYETTFEQTADLEHFREILSLAVRVERLAFPAPSEDAFLAAGRRIVELSDEMIVAWDGQPAKGKGGTADIVRYAGSLGKPVYNVWPEGVVR